MVNIKLLLLKYPSQIRYILLILNIFIILVSTRIFINYNNIEIAIDETINNTHQKELELNYIKHFAIIYEQSNYAQYFLKHENNILFPGEFIVKFETKQTEVSTGIDISIAPLSQKPIIKSPKDSWNLFFRQRIIDNLKK